MTTIYNISKYYEGMKETLKNDGEMEALGINFVNGSELGKKEGTRGGGCKVTKKGKGQGTVVPLQNEGDGRSAARLGASGESANDGRVEAEKFVRNRHFSPTVLVNAAILERESKRSSSSILVSWMGVLRSSPEGRDSGRRVRRRGEEAVGEVKDEVEGDCV
ncbi:hypothetical protein SESBI_29907 [Sesbania bispinosa]|nr:hypothetical protein SESBI_29907 [Sesbania bispinosa]